MKTKENTIRLLEKKEGNAKCVETQGIYESNVIGKYEWGIMHNGIGVRWYAIHKIGRQTYIHVYEEHDEMIEYIKSNIM